jgi:hypothetical protein
MEKKRAEKLRYMHRNPVVRGLMVAPEVELEQLPSLLRWESEDQALVNEAQKAECGYAELQSVMVGPALERAVVPTRRKPRRVGQP